ncbi:hypothetical protein [Endozoicomonas sp. ALB032]|uniref:hypothetical protein n=1 Tax=Endozoicomonas sp. ALB032 TaxID=3403082 RepID=UPI003BB76B9E
MTNARPNALSLAVAVAISSTLIGAQALADRKLQIKAADIPGNGHVEITLSEVNVQPTLGNDQQPVPKSFTTTYPAQPRDRLSHHFNSVGFSEALADADGDVSIIDVFETGKNGVARKYTKVLKVGDEGLFRFTHDLKQEKLAIEVRSRMTDQDSIEVVRSQSSCSLSLEPLTKIASSRELAEVLNSVDTLKGQLGESDHYVPLATVEVEKVAVEGRTFMRLIAAGDQPPDLQRLGQTVFVNDDVLLAAATSAYIRVHVLGEELQQQALNELLALSKPVGFVVHVEDDKQIFHVPPGYSRLEVKETPGEVIVFHGQMQDPQDVVFVESLHNLWKEAELNNPTPAAASAAATKVMKHKVKSYQYVLRSKQMTVLEGLIVRYPGTSKYPSTILADKDRREMHALSYYEYLMQALASATPDEMYGSDTFELTLEHIRVASYAITPTWQQIQLAKHFSFKPVLRHFLTKQLYVQGMLNLVPNLAEPLTKMFHDDPFMAKILSDMAGQLVERELLLEKHLATEGKLIEVRDQLKLNLATEGKLIEVRDQLKLKVERAYTDSLQLKQRFEDEIAQMRTMTKTLQDQSQKLQRELARISELEQEVIDAGENARKAYNAQLAEDLGIDNRDDDQPTEEQFRLIRQKIHEIGTAAAQAGTGHPKAMREALVLKTVSDVEEALELEIAFPCNKKEFDIYLRRSDISQDMDRLIRKARYQAEKEALDLLEFAEQTLNLNVNKDDDKMARFIRVFRKLDTENHSDDILNDIDISLWTYNGKARDERDIKLRRVLAHLHYKIEAPAPNKLATEQQIQLLEAVESILTLTLNEGHGRAARVALVHSILEGGDPSEETLDLIDQTLWKQDSAVLDERALKLRKLGASLAYKVEDWYLDIHSNEQQKKLLAAIEHELNIFFRCESHAANKRGKAFTARLASDLDVAFEEDAFLLEQKDALTGKIWGLIDELNEVYQDESIKRARNNEMACQLAIKDYKEDATIRDQNSLIEAKLLQLDEEVFKAGSSTVNERITAIENELDRYMALLPKPKPRYALDREVAIARRKIKEAESELLAAKEQVSPEAQDEGSKADIKKMKTALKAAEKAVEDDGGPFQYTPIQAETLNDLHIFAQQHPLKQLALQVANGLAELALENGKEIPYFPIIDFDDEFAPIGLRAMVGDKLTFAQASWVVEVFKNLKTTFPEPPFEPPENHLPLSVTYKVLRLTCWASHGIGRGAKEYDNRIRSMGSAGIDFVEHLRGVLKSFPEYFASHSASGNKIIALLREGLISKAELGNYMKAVRGVDGYQTVDEFEHFLGYKQGVNVPHFKSAVRMLSDKGAEEFMQSAFTPVTVTATDPAAMKESLAGMKEYAAAVIANYVLDDIAFDNGHRTAAFLANAQETLTPYANAAGLSESELLKAVHGTLMQAHAAVVEYQFNEYWGKPSAFLVQAVTWYYSSYKPLLVTHTSLQAAEQSLLNMSFLYLLDLTNRGDYLHRMLTPFQHWLEGYGVDPDRTGQYAYHSGIEKVSEVGGLAMPLGKAASSVILLRTGSMLFARQYNANPQMYRSISRLVPEIVKSMGSGQGVQVPLLHRATPQKVKTLASATAGLVLGPVATFGAYAHGLISGFTYAQSFGFALASGLTFDFLMNDNKLLTQWLGGPLGRSLDKMNRWMGAGETQDEYLKRTTIATPQGFSENDEAYTNRVKANNTMYGWTRHEHYLQFRERRDRTMKLFDNGWEKYFRENVPKWSFSHAESIPYSYTLGAFYKWRQGDDKKSHVHDKRSASPIRLSSQL